MAEEVSAAADLELLDRWCAGDTDAGDALLARYFPQVFRFFRNKIDDGVEDLVQRTFLACVENRDRYRRDASFRTYLFSIARRLLYKRYHLDEKDRATVELSEASAYSLSPSPSRILVARAEQRLLLEALRRIPLYYQIALELYHWERLTGPELAVVLDVPEATVRSRIRRGTAMLKRHLEQLAESGEVLRSTLANLDSWAASIRGQVDSS